MTGRYEKVENTYPRSFIQKGVQSLFFNSLNIKRQSPGRYGEAGYGLLLSLVFTAFLGGLVTVAVRSDQARIQQEQARSAAWHMALTAKAARIFVRNNSTDDSLDTNADGVPDDIYSLTTLAGAPAAIPIANLVNAGLLPPNYQEQNVFGQTISVFAAPFPLTGGAVTPVSTAYVYLPPESFPSPANMLALAQAAAEFDTVFEAPIFDTTPANVSGDCDSDLNPNIVSWGTVAGTCLDSDDFAQFGLGAFQAGALMVPAWRSTIHDTRAMFRYPLPENPSSAVMVTNLSFGRQNLDALGNCTTSLDVVIPGSPPTPSGLCAVDDDDITGTGDITTQDRRVNLVNIGTLEVANAVLTNQAAPEMTSFYDTATGTVVPDFSGDPLSLPLGTPDVLSVDGNMITQGNVWLTGRLAAGGSSSLSFRDAAGVAGRNLNVDHNIAVSNSAAGIASARVTTALDARDVQALESTGIAVSSPNTIINPGNAAGYLGAQNVVADNVTVLAGVIDQGVVATLVDAATLTANAQDVAVVGQVTTGSITVTGTSTAPGTPYTIASGQIVNGGAGAANIIVPGTVNVQSGIAASGNATVSGPMRTGSCFSGSGNCPKITEPPPACLGTGTCPCTLLGTC